MTNTINSGSGQDWEKFKKVILSDPMKELLSKDKYALMTLRQVSNDLNKLSLDSLEMHSVPKPEDLDGSISLDIQKYTQDELLSEDIIRKFDLLTFLTEIYKKPDDEMISYIFTWTDTKISHDMFKLVIDLKEDNNLEFDVTLLSQEEGIETPYKLDTLKELQYSNQDIGNTTKLILFIVAQVEKLRKQVVGGGGAKSYKKTAKKIHCIGRDRVVYVCNRKQYVKVKSNYVPLKKARELSRTRPKK